MNVGPFLDTRTLWKGPDFQVLSSVWDSERHPTDSARYVESASVEWMRLGTYRKRLCGYDLVGDTNTAVFFNPGEEFRVTHAGCRNNRGTTIQLRADFLSDLLGEISPCRGTRQNARFQRTHVTTSPHCHALQQYLLVLLEMTPDVESLVVEEIVCQLLTMVLSGPSLGRITDVECSPPLARRIADVKEFLGASISRKLSLTEVAHMAKCSPWRICHVFRRATGLTIGRYRIQVQLRHALARLHETDIPLTEVALETGFSSHSHMTATIRREFGMTPSQIRRNLARFAPCFSLRRPSASGLNDFRTGESLS